MAVAHRWHQLLDQPRRAHHVDIVQVQHLGGLVVQPTAVGVGSGVVDQDVHVPDAVERLPRDLPCVVVRRQVALDGENLPA